MQFSLEIALLYESFPSAADVWEAVAPTHPELDKVKVLDGFEDKNLTYGEVGDYLRNDSEYDGWQNAEDLAIYAAAGRSTAGLSMKSNGFPFPLTQQIVDTDANPGRWRLRRGWIESVGATMWLRPKFWEVSGAGRAALRSCDGIVMTDIGAGVTKITTRQEVFRNADETEGDLQLRMRAALYDNPGAVR